MDRLTTLSGEFSESSFSVRVWRLLPHFWTVVLVTGLVLNSASVALTSPNRVRGWQAVLLLALTISLVGGYRWFSEGRIYGENTLSERQALLPLAIQYIALVCLVRVYDSSFALLSMSLPYQIIGGLNQRCWLLPLVGVGLIFAIAGLPSGDNGLINTGALSVGVLLIAINSGIALFIRLLGSQRDQLEVALEHLRQAYSALTASAAQAEELAVLRERTRLARSLHDEIGQTLVLMNVKLEAAQLLYARDPVRGDAELEAARTLIRSTMTDLRHALADLRSPDSDYADFPRALLRLAEETQMRTGIPVACQIEPGLSVMLPEVRQMLWYVVREALTNSERHASATHIDLTFEHLTDSWRVRVIDDGSGIAETDLAQSGHYGILGMRERIESVGGTFSIQRGAARGTIVEIILPIEDTSEVNRP